MFKKVRKTISESYTGKIDLCEEEETLSDGSMVYNVVLATKEGDLRLHMTCENAMHNLMYELDKVISKYEEVIVGTDVDCPACTAEG